MPVLPSSIVLSRHGETMWQPEHRYAGVTDIALSASGDRDVDLLAQWAASSPPAAVFASPSRRTRVTAAPAASRIGVEVQVEPDLRELDFGVAEGLTLLEIAQTEPAMVERFLARPASAPFAGAEQPGAAALRMERVVRSIVGRFPGQCVLVVSHSTVMRLMLCALLGIELDRYRSVFPHLDSGALTTLQFPSGDEGAAALVSLNVPLPVAPRRPGDPRPLVPTSPRIPIRRNA